MVGQLNKSEKKSLDVLDERLLGYGLNRISVGILKPLFEKRMTREDIRANLYQRHSTIPNNIRENIQMVWESIPDSEFGEPEEEEDTEDDYEKLREENNKLRSEISFIRGDFKPNIKLDIKSVAIIDEIKQDKPAITRLRESVEKRIDNMPRESDQEHIDNMIDNAKSHQTLVLKNVKVDTKNVGSVISDFFASRDCRIFKLDYSLEKPFSVEFIVPRKNTWIMIQKIENNPFIESYEELRLL